MNRSAGRARIALVGNRSPHVPAHERLDVLIPSLEAEFTWIASEEIADAGDVREFDGIWVIPGSPYVSQSGVLTAIRHARENGVPFLGTCGGFQHALLEFARSRLDLHAAEDVQYDADAEVPLIVPLVCSLKGERAELHLREGSRLYDIFGRRSATVTYHCSYGLNPGYTDLVTSQELLVTAWDDTRAARAVELPEHRFFVATLFQPERAALAGRVPPLVAAFVAATASQAGGR